MKNLKYALVKDNEIVKFKSVPIEDNVIISKLLAHNYLIVEEQEAPIHDYITQTVSDFYEIQKDRVLRTWSIQERIFSESQQLKKDILIQDSLDEIKNVFNTLDEKIEVDKILTIKDSINIEINVAKNNSELRDINVDWDL